MEFKSETLILPTYFHILDDEDKKHYMILRDFILQSQSKYKRYNRIKSIQEALVLIHDFCIKNKSDDWKRCFVCGICWINECVAINIHHLSILIDKCKSSINGAFSIMGYKTISVKSPLMNELITFIPILKENAFEKKQWTIRRKENILGSFVLII